MNGRLVALALYMGPGLVLAAANDEWFALAALAIPLGIPISEAFAAGEKRHLIRALRHCYLTGQEVRMIRPDGILWLIPYVSPDGCRGVVSHYRATPAPLGTLVPVLPLTA